MVNFTYSPLPPLVKLMPSDLHGWGVFSTEFLPEGTYIGISHVEYKHAEFHNDLIRTPLGGYINHSDKPNCIILTSDTTWRLYTSADIYPHDELTVDYRLYRCGGL